MILQPLSKHDAANQPYSPSPPYGMTHHYPHFPSSTKDNHPPGVMQIHPLYYCLKTRQHIESSSLPSSTPQSRTSSQNLRSSQPESPPAPKDYLADFLIHSLSGRLHSTKLAYSASEVDFRYRHYKPFHWLDPCPCWHLDWTRPSYF